MSSDQFTHRLVLPSVRLSDAGEYTAVAGSNMSKAHLGVEGRDVKISEPASRNVSVGSHHGDVDLDFSKRLTFKFLVKRSIWKFKGFERILFFCCRLLRSREQLWSWR